MEQLPHALIAELDQRGFIDLQVATAGIGERMHFPAVRVDEVGPEPVEIGIGIPADIGAAGAIVDVAGAGKRDLGGAAGQRPEIAKILGVLRALPFDAADHPGNAPRHSMAVALRPPKALVLGHLDLHAGNAGAGEGVGISPAPELAVGDDVEADLLLQRDHLPDGVVLDRAQSGAVDQSLRVLLARP